MKTDTGVKLWKRAKGIIPGGTQLLSKRSEMFLPEQWPSYFKKAKGVEVWDLDGNHYIDMSIMGVGACILGYADDDVDRAVKKVIDTGSMCTLNSVEEIELGELLLRLHPWAQMVRYTRTGGEAMAAAVRIARGFSGKDKIAFCGYHGWHDWYLSANLADEGNLDGQLLPGLKPLGVPRALKGTAIPFNYNRIDELDSIISAHDIGTIVVEPIRHHEPEDDFLGKIRRVADRIGAVLIFDEITSGWRMRVGGVHDLYNVYPDVVVYAKAMGNGFPIAALIGKKDVMNTAQESFISSTFWTERIGPAAAIATINKMQEKEVPTHLCKIGRIVIEGWNEVAKKHDLEIDVMGIPALPTFSFKHQDSTALHTLFTREMLNRGLLASRAIYVSYSHTQQHVERYLKCVDEVFGVIKKAIGAGNVLDLVGGPVAHTGFKRLA